jgi:hypothetical protein
MRRPASATAPRTIVVRSGIPGAQSRIDDDEDEHEDEHDDEDEDEDEDEDASAEWGEDD